MRFQDGLLLAFSARLATSGLRKRLLEAYETYFKQKLSRLRFKRTPAAAGNVKRKQVESYT